MTEKFKKFLHKLSFKRVSYEKKPLYNPPKDWKFGLLIFSAAAIVVGALHWYLFQLIEQGAIFTKSANETFLSTAVNRESIQTVVREFDLRSEELEALKAQAVEEDDPSI